MRAHRFLGEFDLQKENFTLTEAGLVRQIRTVLRMKPGGRLELVTPDGEVGVAEIVKISSSGVDVKVLEVKNKTKNDDRQTILFAAILKRENFEWIAQKATEVGVDVLVPVITARTVKTGLKEERLLKIITEATEQSGRTETMQLKLPHSFKEALDLAASLERIIVCHQGGTEFQLQKKEKSIGVFIGPEGGWESSELQEFEAARAEVVTLGETTLRAETAAIIASYLVCQGK